MKRGRPKETINPVRVSIRFSAVHYDQFDELAARLDMSVPRLIRNAALMVLKNRAMAQTSP